jgi:hypothetical protein
MEYFGLTTLLVTYRSLRCPRQGTVAFHMGTVACPTFDWVHKVLEDMHTDMA